jgi:ribonuclease HII
MSAGSAAPTPRSLPEEAYMRARIGADENGLGPRLGPLVVTAVLADVEPEAWDTCGKKPKGALRKRLGDSKAFVAHGNIELAEAWARALALRGCARHPAESPAELVRAISLDDAGELERPCPEQAHPQCWGALGEAFTAPDKLVRTLSTDLDRLADKGIAVKGVRSAIVCAKRLNDEVDAGRHRFTVDLHSMERLVLSFAESAGSEVYAVCGKVGGFGKYSQAFGPLGGRLHATVEETRRRSTYRFPGVGVLSFVQDADASDLLVSMASMVGKYLREILMARIVRHYQLAAPDLPDASGYHDPVTTTFVKETALLRKRAKIPDRCFIRRSL